MLYLDTETCGFHGPIVLLQYADGVDGEVKIVDVWKNSVSQFHIVVSQWFFL